MTAPTADAAKLLPFSKIVERLREYARPDRDSGIYPMMFEVEEVRGLLIGIDTRPQPAPPANTQAVQVVATIPEHGGHGYSGPYPGSPPAGEPDFNKLAEEIEDWMPDKSSDEMSHKEYIRQFAAFLKNRITSNNNPRLLLDNQIRHMVDRFLGWRLPKPWTPDNGISYVRPNYMHPPADHDWPTGTNLFDYTQAEAMVRYMVEGLPTENTRPQPAPPAGESDLRRRLDKMYVTYGAAHAALSKLGVPAMDGETVIELDERIRRLGLAAPPKVEDAEVAALCAELRQPSGIGEPLDHSAMSKAADLLERLAEEVGQYKRAECCHFENVAELEAKLASREAELAKVDGFLILGWSIDDALDEHPYDDIGDIARDVQRRHAARQQQKASAEPTARVIEQSAKEQEGPTREEP